MNGPSLPLYSNTEMQTAYRHGREDERQRIAAIVADLRDKDFEHPAVDPYAGGWYEGLNEVLAIIEGTTDE